MRRKKKGISPLVAVIMLIAFTMIVAGILAGWATRFASEQRATLEKCVRSNLVIRTAVYNSATSNMTLMLYNAGTVPLRDFQVTVTYDEGGPLIPSTWGIDSTLGQNTFQTYVHNLTNTNIEYIEIRSVECPGAYDLIRGYDVVFS
jgi:flagellin-like protein